MKIKSIFSLLLVNIILILILTGCGGSQPSAIEIVPETANLVVQIRVSELLNDQELMDAFNNMSDDTDEPETMEDTLDEFKSDYGIDIRMFSDVLLFTDSSAFGEESMGLGLLEESELGSFTDSDEYFGIIAEGDFNENDIINAIEEESGETLTTGEYNGYTIYTGKKDNALVFFSSKLMVLGTEDSVKDSIDVYQGDKEAFGGSALNTFNNLGNADIKAVFAAPPDDGSDMGEELLEDSPISMDVLDAFSDMDILGLSFDKQSQNLSLKVEFHFLNEESAQDAGDAINGFIILFKSFMSNDELKDMLGSIDFNTSGDTVSLSLSTTISEMEALVDSMQDEFSE